jgi:uncharacterized protein (UPF0276 family)
VLGEWVRRVAHRGCAGDVGGHGHARDGPRGVSRAGHGRERRRAEPQLVGGSGCDRTEAEEVAAEGGQEGGRRSCFVRRRYLRLDPEVNPTGVGLGLRWEFIDELLHRLPDGIDFLEVSPENYMRRGGYYPAALAYARDRYPLVTHGLTLSIGGDDPFDDSYLRELRDFIEISGSPWHSDHLCFGSSDGRVLHDLLPIAFKEREIPRIAERIKRARDALGRPLAIENISFYMHPGAREMSEPEFLSRVCEAADCGLMLDVNNAYVNAQNFGFDVDEWMRNAPLDRVVQIHVAGHERFDDVDGGSLVIDTHGALVSDPVLSLLERTLATTGAVPVLLERDNQIPSLGALLAELATIRTIWTRATRGRDAHGQ